MAHEHRKTTGWRLCSPAESSKADPHGRGHPDWQLRQGLPAGPFSPGLLAPESLSREPLALLWALALVILSWPGSSGTGLCSQKPWPEALRELPAGQCGGIGRPSGQESRCVCTRAGSQWQLRKEQENRPGDGVGALKGWVWDGGCSPRVPGGPGRRRGLPEHGTTTASLSWCPWLWVRCCQTSPESEWSREDLHSSLTPPCPGQEKFHFWIQCSYWVALQPTALTWKGPWDAVCICSCYRGPAATLRCWVLRLGLWPLLPAWPQYLSLCRAIIDNS